MAGSTKKKADTTDKKPVTIVYDTDLMRPACVLIQRAYGANVSTSDLSMLFPVGSWLVAPTSGMRGLRVTRDELKLLGQKTAR